MYFLIIVPIVLIVSILLLKFEKIRNTPYIIIILGLLLFFVRIVLIFFSDTIGIMPYIYPDILFYSLLTIFGVIFTISYVKIIEKVPFKKIGYEFKKIGRSILFGFLSFLPLIAIFPLMLFLTDVVISLNITWEKIILGIEFGLILGGFYEEVMFRGIIQNYFMEMTDDPKKFILFTSLIFVATHIGYLPFTGYGIYYLFIFIMALILSVLRYKFDLLACSILHGGIVFILIIFV
ncbi:MAG: CPBP family intramembrane glutamic endopeptidase [Candidatus Helarchaeota archaeon]